MLLAVVLHLVRLHFAVHFARTVDEADVLCLRDELGGKLHLCVHGCEITDPGHIAAGSLIILYQLGTCVVSDRSTDDRDVLDLIRCCLRRRCRDGADQLRFLCFEAGNDGLQIRLVALCIFLIDLDLIRPIAALLQCIDKAFIGFIERAVLHNLHDTDLDLARGVSALPAALSTAAAGNQSRRCEHSGYTAFHPVFHLMLPSFIYTILYGVQG